MVPLIWETPAVEFKRCRTTAGLGRNPWTVLEVLCGWYIIVSVLFSIMPIEPQYIPYNPYIAHYSN